MLSFLSFKRANLHFTDVHLHSYCRMFFHSSVYNTYSSQICPHSCQPASHMISGSFLISQLWSETLKLWKQTVWKLLEAEALSCNPLYWELEIKRPPKEKSATERSTFKSETQSRFLCCKLSCGTTVCKTSANVHPQKFQNEDSSFRNPSFNVSKLFFPTCCMCTSFQTVYKVSNLENKLTNQENNENVGEGAAAVKKGNSNITTMPAEIWTSLSANENMMQTFKT